MPVTAAAAAGVTCAMAARAASRFFSGSAGFGLNAPSPRITLIIAISSAASLPGRMKWCSLAISAVSLRRGSTTTTLPPRDWIAFSRRATSGTVIMLPLEAIGLPPRIRKWSVRSMSGIGIRNWWPNISNEVSCCGSWSTDEALNALRVFSRRAKCWMPSSVPRLCTEGLPA